MWLASLSDSASISSIGGFPGDIGITLASPIYNPFIFVSKFLSTTSPIAAVPPGCAPLNTVDVIVVGSTPIFSSMVPAAAVPCDILRMSPMVLNF